MNNLLPSLKYLFIFIFLIVLVGIGPVFTILSINALFATAIGLTFSNWLAVVWLTAILGGIFSSKSFKK